MILQLHGDKSSQMGRLVSLAIAALIMSLSVLAQAPEDEPAMPQVSHVHFTFVIVLYVFGRN